MSSDVRHSSSKLGPAASNAIRPPGSPALRSPGILDSRHQAAALAPLSALDLAQLAALLSPSLKKPADECFPEAEALYAAAHRRLTGFDDLDGPAHLYAQGMEILLQGAKSINEVPAFPDIEVEIDFFVEDTVATAGPEEPLHDKISVRAINTWRGLQKAVARLVRDGYLDEHGAAVAEVAQVKVTRHSVREINRSRVHAEAVGTLRRRRATAGTALYVDPDTRETRTIGLDPALQQIGTAARNPGTPELKNRGDQVSGKPKNRNTKPKSQKSDRR